MGYPPTDGPYGPGRSPDPGNLPGRRGGGGFFRRLFGGNRRRQRRPQPPRYEPPPPEPIPTGPDTPPEEAPERYDPDRFSPEHERRFQRGAGGMSREDDEYARELYQKGFITRGPGSKAAREEWFDFTGQDPRTFDWENWRREAGSP